MKNLYREIIKDNLSKSCIIFSKEAWTYRDFLKKVDNFAHYLIKNNIKEGERIGLTIKQPEILLVAYYGAFKIGVSPVPVPFSDPERIEGAVKSANLSVLIGESLVIESEFENKIEESDVAEGEAMVIFTSGTTSKKLKGVRLANQGISHICSFMNRRMEVDESIIECVCAPIDHAFGFGRCHSVLSKGGTINLVSLKRGLGVLFDSISENKCNALSAPPSILSSLIRVSKSGFERIASQLKWLQTGAMRFDPTFRRNLIDYLPSTRIFMHYGLSEAMRVTFFEINKYQNKLNTEGPLSEGVDMLILDHDYNALENGQEGRIAIKGKNLCLGYLDNLLWKKNLFNDWFITSDLGILDQDGFLIFCGRSDDTINSNGVLVHPDEIESKLAVHIQDKPFSVLGIPDPQSVKDGIIVLCFEGKPPISKVELAGFLNSSDKHLIPHLIQSVEALPKTRSGKVNRTKLREIIVTKLQSMKKSTINV